MGQVNLTCSVMAASTTSWRRVMTDTPRGPTHRRGSTNRPARKTSTPLTNEERLRALTSDHHRKTRGKTASGPVDAQRRPGDTVDAVRERSNMDPGRDTPS